MEGSAKFQLNKRDLKKIGVGALIAVIGALLTFLEDTIPGVSFAVYVGGQVYDFTAIAVAINSILVNTVRKALTDYSAQQTDILE